mgnify:FL=1
MNTPDLSDQNPELPFLLGFNSYGKLNYLSGLIRTVKCPDDNSKAKMLLSTPGNGDILFIDGNASSSVALLGDNLAALALENSWGGIVVNGCVRDVEVLKNLPICIFALGACPKRSKKNNRGEVGVSVEGQGVKIDQGFWIYADQNGILISAKKLDAKD